MTEREMRLCYRAPLLKMAQVAVFRQITLGQARYRYQLGDFPRGERPDGELFIAEKRFVVRALQFRALLDEPTRKVFDAWQRGEIEIDEPRRDSDRGVLPVLLKLSESASANQARGC